MIFAGTRDNPQFVGLSNYIEILTVRGKPFAEWLSHGSFYLTLLVTVLLFGVALAWAQSPHPDAVTVDPAVIAARRGAAVEAARRIVAPAT